MSDNRILQRILPGIATAVMMMSTACVNELSAGDISAREIAIRLTKTTTHAPIDLSGRKMRFLDLSGLDFKQAILKGADLHGSDLTGANLTGTNLSAAILDRATIVRVDFSEADLSDALIRLPHSAGNTTFDRPSAPAFLGANLTRARIVGRFDGADFRRAKLRDANFSPYGDWTQNTLSRRAVLVACYFTRADLRGADLTEAILRFADFRNANLTGVNLTGADLSSADLSGADMSGALIAHANFDGAKLTGVRGWDNVKARAKARNLDRAKR